MSRLLNQKMEEFEGQICRMIHGTLNVIWLDWCYKLDQERMLFYLRWFSIGIWAEYPMKFNWMLFESTFLWCQSWVVFSDIERVLWLSCFGMVDFTHPTSSSSSVFCLWLEKCFCMLSVVWNSFPQVLTYSWFFLPDWLFPPFLPSLSFLLSS